MQITEVKNIFVSVLALINEENEVLIGERPNLANSFPNYWEFPGGKIKRNESPQDAIIREAKEEIDIDIIRNCIAPLSFSTHFDRGLNTILLLYIARKWERHPLPKFHSRLLWVNVNKLRSYKMPPANNYLVASLQDLL